MEPRDNIHNVYASIHHTVTGQLLYLLDGLFQNIEHGLEDIASRPDGEGERCLLLLQDTKGKRSTLIHLIAERMQNGFETWLGNASSPAEVGIEEIESAAQDLSEKSAAHFDALLRAIAERAENALGKATDHKSVPISPYRVSSAFLESCHQLSFDAQDTAMLSELFGRYVLDRLGHTYGVCNRRLMEAGHLTQQEQDYVPNTS